MISPEALDEASVLWSIGVKLFIRTGPPRQSVRRVLAVLLGEVLLPGRRVRRNDRPSPGGQYCTVPGPMHAMQHEPCGAVQIRSPDPHLRPMQDSDEEVRSLTATT